MTRINPSSVHTAAHQAQSPKAELSSLQQKIEKQFLGANAKEVKAPSASQLKGAEKLVVNMGVDRATTAYVIDGKMYAATTGFTGMARWVELPKSDLNRFEALKKDLGQAATKLPASKWSSTGPHFLNGSDSFAVTPKGEMGVGYRAYVFGSEIWVAKTPVVPNAKTLWAKL